LCHPGETRTEQTIRQHFYWKNLRETVHKVCSTCSTCQITKKSHTKYGHLPPKEAEAEPWDKLCVDLVGPYTITSSRNKRKKAILWAVTMIDPATGWFEMKELKERDAMTVANIVEMTWLSRYPKPQELIFDRGTEFMGDFAKMIKEDYGITRRGTTVRNPQANSILERIHQTLGNIVRTFEPQDLDMDSDSPWEGILSAAMFALRSTYHTTLQATPMQLVFGRDAFLNVKFEADWQLIKERKQARINANNQRENQKRKPHTYQVGDKVLYNVVQGTIKPKYGQNPFAGPYEVLRANNNGTVVLQKGPVIETVNIRLIKPFRE